MSNLTKPQFLFDDFLTKDWFESSRQKFNGSVPKVNILESSTQFTIQMAAPGLKKSDFKLEFRAGQLSLERVHNEGTNVQDAKYTLREFAYDSFKRTFTLPKEVTQEDIQASYEDGILEVVILKRVPQEPKETQIEIK